MKRWLLWTTALATAAGGCQLVLEYEPFPDEPTDPKAAVCERYDALVGDCAGGFRDCNGDAADGCETDTNTSPASCGYCGHTCEDGCDSGLCAAQPITAARPSALSAFGVHRGSIYFTGSDIFTGISVVSVADGEEMTLPVFGVDTRFAFDGDFIYATGFQSDLCDGTNWCAVVFPVGATTPTVLAEVAEYPRGIATTESSVFVAEDPSGGRIARIAKSGGSLLEVATSLGDVRGLSGTPAWVYWGTASGLMRASDDGSVVESVADDDVDTLATYGDEVYWVTDGRIRTLGPDGPETLVEGVGDTTWLGVSQAHLYWVSDALYRFVRCETGRAEVIGSPSVAAVDDDSIYFATEAGTRPVRRQH